MTSVERQIGLKEHKWYTQRQVYDNYGGDYWKDISHTCDCTLQESPQNCKAIYATSNEWTSARISMLEMLGDGVLGGGTTPYPSAMKRACFKTTEHYTSLMGIKEGEFSPSMVAPYIGVLQTLYAIEIKEKGAPAKFQKQFKQAAAHAEPFVFEYLGLDKSTMFMQVKADLKRTSSALSSSSSSSAPRKRNGRPLQPGQQPYVSCQTRVWAGRGDQVLLPALLSIIEQYDCFIATFCWLSNDRVLDAMRGKALYLRIEDNKDNKEELYKDILVSEVDKFKCGQHEYDVELLRASPLANGLSHSHSKMLVAGSLRGDVFIPVVGIIGSYNPTNTTSMDSMVEMYPADHVAHAILQETFIELS